MSSYRSSRLTSAALFMLTILISSAMVVALPGTLNARDRGINQPGADRATETGEVSAANGIER